MPELHPHFQGENCHSNDSRKKKSLEKKFRLRFIMRFMERFHILNQRGLIPGPQETEEQFSLRVDRALTLAKPHDPRLNEALSKTKELYDIAPDWVPVKESKEGLAFWHAGCLWITQEENEPPQALLQLKPTSRLTTTEIVSHELCHAARITYEEEQFEEMLAYRTATARWRRFWGPLIQSTKESAAFMVSLILVLCANFLWILIPDRIPIQSIFALALVPCFLLLFWTYRLFWRHRILNRALKQLTLLLGNEKRALSLLFRLSDREIDQFQKMSPVQITDYVLEHKTLSFRWHFLASQYFEE
jgi:hypothetical protein